MLVPLGLALPLIAWLWWPALLHRTPIWGDTLVHGWPLLLLHARALHGHASLLWSRDIYGGHPVFAEGQGGFAHPLNIALALLVTPLFGPLSAANALHAADMLTASVGMALLGRRVGLGAGANGFATVAMLFSPAMLLAQNNISIGNALGFVPLSLWAFERWTDRADAGSAAWLAASLSMVLLAGYPQALHALALVLAARLLAVATDRDERRRWWRQRRRRLATLSLWVMLLLGLTAVQTLPLLQLARLSHRAGGIALLAATPWRSFLRGCAMGDLDAVRAGTDDANGLGSLLVSFAVLLSAWPVLRRGGSARWRGLLLAALLCALAAIGDTPVFALLHDRGLLPGMRFFRVTQLYATVGIVPLSLLAGYGLQRAAELPRAPAILSAVLAAAGLAAVLLPLHPVLAPAAVWTAALLLPVPALRPRALPAAATLLLLAEVATLRAHPFPFLPEALLRMPDSASIVRRAPSPTDRRTLQTGIAGGYGLMLPHDPRVTRDALRMVDSLVPMTTLSWDIPSLGGALALPLRRRALAEPLLARDAGGPAAPGASLLDLLAVRFLFADGGNLAGAYRPLRPGDAGRGWLYANDRALPFAQGFARHVAVPGPEQAARRLASLTAPALVIEDPAGRAPPDPADAAAPTVLLRHQGQTRYVLEVRAGGPGWVVLCDADYPGWTATLDGASAPVFPAQLLAKAVPVPAGRHLLVLRFRSPPFEIGLCVSLASLALLAAIPLYTLKRNSSTSPSLTT